MTLEFFGLRDYSFDHTYATWHDINDLPIGIESIERPNLNNQPEISCIPEGRYLCSPFNSPTKGEVFLLTPTEPRENIEIHDANWAFELEGCIAPGLKRTMMMYSGSKHPDYTGKICAAVSNSSTALMKLKNLTNYQPFYLTLKEKI